MNTFLFEKMLILSENPEVFVGQLTLSVWLELTAVYLSYIIRETQFKNFEKKTIKKFSDAPKSNRNIFY